MPQILRPDVLILLSRPAGKAFTLWCYVSVVATSSPYSAAAGPPIQFGCRQPVFAGETGTFKGDQPGDPGVIPDEIPDIAAGYAAEQTAS